MKQLINDMPQPKDKLNTDNPPRRPIECEADTFVKSIYVLSVEDCVIKNGEFIRVKRKYGKFKRLVHKIK